MSKAKLSPWTIVTFVVIAVLSTGAWALVRSGVARQNKALVQNGAAQVALTLQTTAQNFQTELRSLAFFTPTSGYSSDVFTQQAQPLLTNPKASVGLADLSGQAPKVLLARGPDLRNGETLTGALAAALSGSSSLTSTVVTEGPTTYLVLAANSIHYPNLVAFTLRPFDASKATPNAKGPYRDFYINIYNGPKPGPARLIFSTYGPNALPSPIASSVVKVGKVVWLVDASPKAPPAGVLASDSPWMILVGGLVIAMSLAMLVEVLARHNRASRLLVEKRTGDLLDAQRTIIRQERLSAVGEMAAVVGHELRNPLATATNHLFLARMALVDGAAGDGVDSHLAIVEQQISRAARLSTDLTAYMRDYDAKLTSVESSAVIAKALATTPPPGNITVAVDGSALLTADPMLMEQILTNLITNAYQAMPDGGSVTLSVQTDPSTKITVDDDGPGIDPAIESVLFDPFVTTRPTGTGLGLAIVKRLVEAQGATVDIENRDGGGARVTISFPPGSVEATSVPSEVDGADIRGRSVAPTAGG